MAANQEEELARAKRRDGREEVLKKKLEKVIEAYGKMKKKYQHEKEKNSIRQYRCEQENSPSPVVPMELAIDADYRCMPQGPPLMPTGFKLDSPPKLSALTTRSDQFDNISQAGRSYGEDSSTYFAKETRVPKRKGRLSLRI